MVQFIAIRGGEGEEVYRNTSWTAGRLEDWTNRKYRLRLC